MTPATDKNASGLPRWLRDVDPVLVIYRRKTAGAIVVGAVFGLLFLVIVLVYFRRLPYVIAVGVAVVMALVPLVLECRRAIILSPMELISRRNTGTLERIPIAVVLKVEETSMTYMLGPLPVSTPAIRLILKTGQARCIPIDYPERDEIVARVKAAVACSIGSQVPLE
jgi:hypothetical protein